jgi:hypothetical protein
LKQEYSIGRKKMGIGVFSVSLTVKDLAASKAFSKRSALAKLAARRARTG